MTFTFRFRIAAEHSLPAKHEDSLILKQIAKWSHYTEPIWNSFW